MVCAEVKNAIAQPVGASLGPLFAVTITAFTSLSNRGVDEATNARVFRCHVRLACHSSHFTRKKACAVGHALHAVQLISHTVVHMQVRTQRGRTSLPHG